MGSQLLFIFLFIILWANNKYPDNGSKTCCHGLIEFGLWITTFLFFCIDLIISGMILFFLKSPPPITFPALTLATFLEDLFLKKLW